jgi:hypothetical protein
MKADLDANTPLDRIHAGGLEAELGSIRSRQTPCGKLCRFSSVMAQNGEKG